MDNEKKSKSILKPIIFLSLLGAGGYFYIYNINKQNLIENINQHKFSQNFINDLTIKKISVKDLKETNESNSHMWNRISKETNEKVYPALYEIFKPIKTKNTHYHNREYLLKYALENNNTKLVEYLIDKGVAKNDNLVLDSVLDRAIKNNNFELVKYLVNKGFKLTPSHIGLAAKTGNLKLVKYLMKKVKLNKRYYRTIEARIALENALESGNFVLVEYLIKQGIRLDSDILNNFVKNNNFEIVKYLINKKGIKPDSLTIITALKSNNLKMLKYIVDKTKYDKNELKFIFDDYQKEVYSVIQKGNLNLVKYLVNKGCLKFDNKALDYAAVSGNLKLVKYIINKGIRPNINTLNNAVYNGHLKIVKYLINEKGIKPDTNDYSLRLKHPKNNTLNYAALGGQLEVVKYLLSIGCKLNYQYITNRTMNNAAVSGNIELVKFLIRKGIKPNQGTLEIATKYDHLKLVKYLMEVEKIPYSCLMYNSAQKTGDKELIDYIKQYSL